MLRQLIKYDGDTDSAKENLKVILENFFLHSESEKLLEDKELILSRVLHRALVVESYMRFVNSEIVCETRVARD
jgi:hypothetical protein